MKKMKKLFAILMTMAMVMGLGITGFAATNDVENPATSKITVTGLSAGVATTVNVYKYATLQYNDVTNEYSWRIESWAEDYVELNNEKTAWTVKEGQEAALKAAAQDEAAYRTAKNVEGTTCEFSNMPIGGYIIIPSDGKADYNPLFAVNTYDRTSSPDQGGKIVAKDITVIAKSDMHTVVKSQSDDFVQIGSPVDYTIKATFPAYKNSVEEVLNSFVITDTPVGVDIDDTTVVVKLGTSTLVKGTDYTVSKNSITGVLTIKFINTGLFTEDNQGKEVVITYSATVTDTTYNNTVGATSSTTDYNNGKTTGENGSISITKVDIDDKDKTPLAGAEFKVYDLGVNGIWNAQEPGNPMNFVYDEEERAYRPALSTDAEEDITDTIIATGGVVKVVGLDEGNYHFEETKAPSGYAINDLGETYTIANEENKIDISEYFEDTKMAALPETGGMGTTLFTIAGCVIMISAAGLFFATRKKAN